MVFFKQCAHTTVETKPTHRKPGPHHVNTRRYLNVMVITDGRQNNVVCLLGQGTINTNTVPYIHIIHSSTEQLHLSDDLSNSDI